MDSKFIKHEVAHHFESAEQEFDTAKLGMWTFLGQELLFFSALFVAYAVFRFLYPAMFLEAHRHLSVNMGFLNTIVLLISSFTMAMAIRSAQVSNKKHTFIYLLVTLVCAGMFMVVKYMEYMEKFLNGKDVAPHAVDSLRPRGVQCVDTGGEVHQANLVRLVKVEYFEVAVRAG
ncbi:hypothetical protein HOL82_03455, partial [Candidatus Woesearchaeota archaeon]|nr:hypothetical protein [Candidatus Woesearchaeota archaeon]